jgi:hypothetical protein
MKSKQGKFTKMRYYKEREREREREGEREREREGEGEFLYINELNEDFEEKKRGIKKGYIYFSIVTIATREKKIESFYVKKKGNIQFRHS